MATTSAYPPVPRPSASAPTFSSTRSPACGAPTSPGYASARSRSPSSRATSSSTAPGQLRTIPVTTPDRQRTMGATLYVHPAVAVGTPGRAARRVQEHVADAGVAGAQLAFGVVAGPLDLPGGHLV